jgi:hypothetical protein
MICFAWNFDRAEARQVVGNELRIEQHESASVEVIDQIGERDF